MNISDQDWKIILALAGTVTGWLLAQGASTAKFFWRRRWLRKHLLIELEDVQAQLGLTLLQYEGLIKIAAIGGIYPQSRVPVETPIYRAFFTEAYATLNRAQRVSYKTTHSAIQSVNAGFDTLRDFLHELDAKNLSKEQLNVRVEDWMGLLKAQYLNASFAYAHVYFHLSNQKRPELGDPYGSVAQWFGEQDHKAADRIKTFIEFAKGKTVSELKVHMAERTV